MQAPHRESRVSIALACLAEGISVIPIRHDGSKAPTVAWSEFQSRRMSDEEAERFFPDNVGIAAVAGSISNGLELIDFDEEADEIFPIWCGLIDSEAPHLLKNLSIVRTPGDGFHVRYRCADNAGNTKLARTPDGKRTRIETRGEGGYFLIEFNHPEAHETGREYKPHSGPSILQLPTVTPWEREVMLRAARSFDEGPNSAATSTPVAVASGDRPGDEFNKHGPSWSEILTPHGWELMRDGPKQYWKRPGKEAKGWSATTGHCSNQNGASLLAVFSANAHPFEGPQGSKVCTCYTKFSAFALLNHNGDYKAASKALRRQGYGKKNAEPPKEDEKPAIVWEAPAAPLDVFPGAVAELIESVTEAFDCPIEFPLLGVLVTASAAIGGTRSLKIKKTWYESARLYAAVVAHPGENKTAPIEFLTKPIKKLQEVALEQFKADKHEYDVAIANATKAEPCTLPKPSQIHYWINECTVAAVAPILAENPRGVLLTMDELAGWIKGMDQFKSGGKGNDRQFFLSAWSGSPFKIDRKGNRDEGSILISHPFLSLIGTIQPDSLNLLVEEKGREDGLIDRFLFACPALLPKRPWSDYEVPDHLKAGWAAAITILAGLQFQMREGRQVPDPVSMSAEARQVWVEWVDMLTAETNDSEFPMILRGPWAKFKSICARLALILHMLKIAYRVEAQANVLSADTMQGAILLVQFFQKHAEKAWETIRKNQKDFTVERAWKWIETRGKPVSARDLQQAKLAKNAPDANKLMETLVEYELGELRNTSKNPGYSKLTFFPFVNGRCVESVEEMCRSDGTTEDNEAE